MNLKLIEMKQKEVTDFRNNHQNYNSLNHSTQSAFKLDFNSANNQ